MKKVIYLIVLALILGLVLTGCLLSNVGQVPTTEQSGITYLTKTLPLANLVGLWHLDELEGIIASDSSGYDNDGTLTNMNPPGCWVSGMFGNALSFDGVDDYVDCGNDESLDPGDNITIEVWIYPTSWAHDTYVGIVSKRDAWLGMDWELYYDRATNRIRVVMGNKLVIHGANTSPSLNAWHHLVYTKSGSVHKLYLDGVNTDTSTHAITVPTGDRVRIGLLGGDFPNRFAFSGTIDQVRIWDGALTESDILFGNVIIDIKPGSDPNSINLGSNGVVPVAILGSVYFDAAEVNPLTVTLSGAAAKLKGNSGNAGSLEDVNDDGYLDRVVQVITEQLVLTSVDTVAVLNAYTYAGLALAGSDWIRIVPPK
jgi:hypothetical protein